VGIAGGGDVFKQMGLGTRYLFSMIIILAYYVPQEALYGRTLGKLATGTKVVDENGGKPSFKQVLGRTFSRFIPFEAFTFFASDARGLHDKLPRTFVVKCR
jgi:uncharacterized RDD family membrane protein YckC